MPEPSGVRCAPAWEFSATGTRWRLYHAGGLGEAQAKTIAAAVERDEARWSRFRADSEISRVNRAAGAWVEVSAETVELLAACRRWTDCTGGVFQPLVGQALNAWGYSHSVRERPPFVAAGTHPEPVQGTIGLDPERMLVSCPAGAAIDIGGIGKGWIASRVASLAVELCEDPRMLIDAGGDLLAVSGEHVVAVDQPGGGAAQAWVRLQAGHAIATSGFAQRSWINGDGRAAHHLIDPATGTPGPLVHATVIAEDPVTADITAKVLALRPQLLSDCERPALVTLAGETRTTPAWAAVLVAAETAGAR